MITNFQVVALYAEKSVKCQKGCGRTLRRRKKLWQTINPWNGTGGKVKGKAEIMKDLQNECAKWRKEPETCKHCQRRTD